MRQSTKEAIDLLKAIASPPRNPSDQAQPGELKVDRNTPEDEVEKALKSASIAGIAKQYRLHDQYAGVALPQPEIGTNRPQSSFEPPIVPVRHVVMPEAPPVAIQATSDCNECGYVYKSVDSCPRCTKIASFGGEALPRHFRGY